jgi:hypothetical protein
VAVGELESLGIIALMKKFTIFGLAVLLVIILGLLWQNFKRPSDRQVQRELTGTWHRNYGGFLITNVIASDGSYQDQAVGRNNVTVHTSEGTLIAKNGVLINTTTKDSSTNVINLQLPEIVEWQIVHIDKHELVISSTFNTNKGALVRTYEKVER